MSDPFPPPAPTANPNATPGAGRGIPLRPPPPKPRQPDPPRRQDPPQVVPRREINFQQAPFLGPTGYTVTITRNLSGFDMCFYQLYHDGILAKLAVINTPTATTSPPVPEGWEGVPLLAVVHYEGIEIYI